MKQKVFTIILVVMMILSVPSFASGQGIGDMNQVHQENQIMLQEHKQTEINPLEQEQERNQLRARLDISSSAAIQQQERLQIQNQQCFSDIGQHWAKEEIMSAYNWEIVNGYPNGEFNPNNSITGPEGLAMMTKMMNKLSGIDIEEVTPGAIDWAGMPEWAKVQLQEQNALRIMTQTAYYNEAQLNRLQFCVMFAKALGIELGEVPQGTITFLDQELIPQAELGYIHRLRVLGIIEGHEGNFYSDRQVTRAEATRMLLRVMGAIE